MIETNPEPEMERRCPRCDSIVDLEGERCLMCGASLAPAEAGASDSPEAMPPDEAPDSVAHASSLRPAQPDSGPVASEQAGSMFYSGTGEVPVVESLMRERQSRAIVWLTAFVFTVTALIGFMILQNPQPVSVAFFPTATPLPPTPTFTPSPTLIPTDTPPPTATPTITPTPLPTSTPPPPRFATIAAGETLFAWSLRYNVSIESIMELNGLENAIVQAGQELQIPWPTATPPLQPVEVEINGQQAIADPTGCERYEIQEGDSLFGVASRYDVPLAALLIANRLSEQDVIQPGDTVCIPQIIYNAVLPPTPGPSPTPSPTGLPPGPHLLYPTQDGVLDDPGRPVVMQWAAVKDLAPDEWYMVEVRDMSDFDSRPHRGFTRQTSFRLPGEWRTRVNELHQMRWRVSIVKVTGQREDGQFIYTFGGRASEDGFFYWQGGR